MHPFHSPNSLQAISNGCLRGCNLNHYVAGGDSLVLMASSPGKLYLGRAWTDSGPFLVMETIGPPVGYNYLHIPNAVF